MPYRDGKNALWAAYKSAPSLVRAKIQIDLQEAKLFRHWLQSASKQYYPLRDAKGSLRDIFIKHLPETAELFGLQNKDIG